ncbi:antitoxin [Gleimia sp. 6138-11-ORH1]|uniref:antitoxin n=1 Tax=Gleimia sp. 6138-11-ORH1 TaxID=2973937 RepID=UPI0021671FC8|nr:antitoxin [Gleimia sp. 6138-11-ORH1]MCS4485170.1 antitoxin [Gleimia sp. 6138-11-ORH1]
MNLDDIKNTVSEKISELTGQEVDLDAVVSDSKANLGDIKETVTSKAAELASEENTDGILDTVAGAVDSATGGKFADKIEAARDFLDSKLGDE